jgi:hypothetical protein
VNPLTDFVALQTLSIPKESPVYWAGTVLVLH